MNFVPMREVVRFAIGGGWGSETEVDGSVLTRVIRGADFPEAAEQNLTNAPLRWEKESRVQTRALAAGDIVLEISGGTKDRPTGRTVLVTQKMVDESVSPLIPASFCRKVQISREIADPKFVYYWLQLMHKSGRAWKHQNQSTGIANFQFEQFLDNEFLWLPSLTTQQAIASILGSLDDKIAANQTAENTGTELLMSLYRRVQKHSAEPFGRVCDVFGGSTPSTKVGEYWGGNINWATPTDLTALRGPWLSETERKITEAGLESMSSTLHPPGSILMTSRATIGHVAVAATPVTTNQGFIVIRASEKLTPWIFLPTAGSSP
ncbi:restriction endonuclease subunit S [Corynebacterium urealyticum]|uniref:Type I restriction-modification system, specificity subunit n=1 Tax=Corynebacterium urealyticum (strain ATCC 43042 / DSM 7109) TaxID=504474 RepID=B1VEB7_CORU7|nr:restriction endonuclease subunit S [Corynebacterium urealyticum]CAQ04106.1 type I restriction-modification system, specificity subunit [Corynebacterium urealyticum DSM 7109]